MKMEVNVMKVSQFSIMMVLGIVLVACGGGSSGTKLLAVKVAKDPTTLSTSELKANHWGYAQSLYTGFTSDGEVSPVNVQEVTRIMLRDGPNEVPAESVAEIIYDSLNSQRYYASSVFKSGKAKPSVEQDTYAAPLTLQNNGSLKKGVTESYDCPRSGQIELKGDLDDGLGKAAITFTNCVGYFGTVNGRAAISIDNEGFGRSTTFYYNRVSYQSSADGPEWELTGYYGYGSGTGKHFVALLQKRLDTGEQYLEQSSGAHDPFGKKVSGELSIDSVGKINFDTNEQYYPYIVAFTGAGDAVAKLDINYDSLKFLIDENADGDPETGLLFVDLYDFLQADLSRVQLHPVAELSYAPEVDNLWLDYYYDDAPTTMDAIVVNSDYYDRDTDYSELVASYQWMLNDEVLSKYETNTLPAGVAVYGDSLQVQLAVFDGVNTSYSDPLDIVLGDTPTELRVTGLPDVVEAGANVSFSVAFYDPDIRSSNSLAPLLAYGPEGATITAEGTIEWASASQLLTDSEVHFGISLEEGGVAEDIPVTVHSAGAHIPIARSGIEVPTANRSIYAADFLAAEGLEVISTDNRQRLFALKYDGVSAFYQAWMYPYMITSSTYEPIVQVATANLDDDAKSEILVATTRGMYLIADENALATEILTLDSDSLPIHAFAVADSDNDGNVEIALLTGSRSPGRAIAVYSLQEGITEVFSTTASESANEIIFSNLDSDPALELITNDGLVYDGASWANQWFYGSDFGGSYLAAGDINGDGMGEIVGGSNWGDLIVYSLVDKSVIATESNFNTCSLAVANVDEDQADELLVGDCQSGSITAYVESNGTLNAEWSVPMQGHGSKSLAAGDVDGDNKVEMMWGVGQSSTGADSFVVAEVLPEAEIQWQPTDPIRLDSFMGAGWANITPDESKAVFIVPSTNSDYDGQRLVYMNDNGVYSVSEQTSNNWEGGRYGVITDFDNNGYDDIFLATAELYDGGLKAMDLETLSVAWELGGEYSDNVGVVEALDMNNDGYDDAIYMDGTTLHIVDVYNELLLGSFEVDSYIRDLAVAETADGAQYIGVATSNGLSLYKAENESLSFVSTLKSSKGCERINFIEQAGSLSLICAASYDSYYSDKTDIVIYEIVEDALVENARFEIVGDITDFIVKNDTGTLLVGLTKQIGSSFSESVHQIAEYSLEHGVVIWSSLPLIGEIRHRSIDYISGDVTKIMFSTGNAMYVVH